MSDHDRFEELGALAVIGQVSASELGELRTHLAQCEPCRKALADFTRIAEFDLPLLHKESRHWLDGLRGLLTASHYKRQFLQLARARGFSFSAGIEKPELVTPSLVRAFRLQNVAIATLFMLSVCASFVALSTKRAYERAMTQIPGAQEKQNVVIEAPQGSGRDAKIAEQERLIARIQSEVAEARVELKSMGERTAALDQQEKIRTVEVKDLKVALEAEAAKSLTLANSLDLETRRAAELNQEVQRLTSLRHADEVQMASEQERVESLSKQLKAQTEVLNEERQLLAAGRDVRELMGARNLHIIDVFDTNLKGKNAKAFGRVFYTEGKSLIFYAFDLRNEQVTNAKYSFQAWGVRDGAGDHAQSLGIFYVDDKLQKRWVLKIEDPDVLSQIDSVFVTVEPFGGAKQPTGQKLLYAFLKSPANHP